VQSLVVTHLTLGLFGLVSHRGLALFNPLYIALKFIGMSSPLSLFWLMVQLFNRIHNAYHICQEVRSKEVYSEEVYGKGSSTEGAGSGLGFVICPNLGKAHMHRCPACCPCPRRRYAHLLLSLTHD